MLFITVLLLNTGVIEVSFQEDSEGYVNLVAYPVNCTGSACTSSSENSKEYTAHSDPETEWKSVDQSQNNHR